MKLRIGVFGARRGLSMVNVYLNHPDAELVAICDQSQGALDKAKAMAGSAGDSISYYTTFDDFFNHDMDAVVLANYATEHVPYAIRFLESGRHVLSEVPACETMSQAVALIEAVEKTGKIYAFGENVSYMPVAFEMQRKYARGDIGEVMYAEGEYIHDFASIMPQITYGDKNHWRCQMYSTFYCTHSIGPVLTITGRRPVQVAGFQTNEALWMRKYGAVMAAGIEMITLDNGSILRSVHGPMKREPAGCKFMLYGMKGMMESDRFDNDLLHAYREGERVCSGDFEHYKPAIQIKAGDTHLETGHGNADLGAPHFFIQRILDRPEGHQYMIDVYTGVDMSICGILAYRSILQGNQPIKVPDLRNKGERDAYRNDHACTNRAVAGTQYIPPYPVETPPIPDATYDALRALWLKGKPAE